MLDGAELAILEHGKAHVGAADIRQHDAVRFVVFRHPGLQCLGLFVSRHLNEIAVPLK